MIKNIPAGGLYRLVAEYEKETPDGVVMNAMICEEMGIRHFGVGDLFLIAGQSNAAGWAMGEYDDGAEIGISAYMDGIWDLASHPLGGAGVGPFLSFAKYMKRKLGYPIGLIPRAIGGVLVSTWIKGGQYMEGLKAERANGLDDVKAVLWYQGCSDTDEVEHVYAYRENFANVLNEMRTVFSNDALPVVTFQLNKLCNGAFDKEWSYNKLRDIQRQIAECSEICYIIPTIDLKHMADAIHNGCGDNYYLGIRAAQLVLDKIYGVEKNYEASNLKSILLTGERELTIEFSNVENEMICFRDKETDYPVEVTDGERRLRIESFMMQKSIIKVVCSEKLSKKLK